MSETEGERTKEEMYQDSIDRLKKVAEDPEVRFAEVTGMALGDLISLEKVKAKLGTVDMTSTQPT
ncbi:MAG: hypothetical protein ACMG6E_04755 [Candidatus Roizmanbacteria bacterium]